MGIVLLDMVMSLDGFIAGVNDEDAGLQNWHLSSDSVNAKVVDAMMETMGAVVIGRRTYNIGASADAFKGHPLRTPHFVLTHEAPTTVAEGVPFTFVTDGIESAIRQAQAVAGDKVVAVGGGASNAQQALRSGLIDEIHIHLVPVLVGEGIRLFENLGNATVELEVIEVIEAPSVTHLKYRVMK